MKKRPISPCAGTARLGGRLLLLWLLFTGSLSAAAAQQPSEEPFRWIDDQVGLVIELREPAPRLRRFSQGALGTRLRRLPPVRRWWSQERDSLRTAFAQLAGRLGFSAEELERVALRRRVVLLLWPPDAPRQDGKLLLLVDCGRKEQALRLEQGLKQLFAPDRNSWKQQQERQCRFWLHRQTRGNDRQETTVVGTLGAFVAVSNDLPTYRRVLRHHVSPPPSGTLAAAASFREARAGCLPGTLLWGFVNLPVWERHIRQEHQLPGGKPRDAEAEQLLRLWPALRYLALGVRAEDHLLCYGHLAYQQQRLPDPLARRLQALAGPSSGFSLLPSDTVAAATVHVDLHRLLKFVFEKGHSRADSAPRPELPPRFVQAGVLAVLSLLRADHTGALIAYADQEGVMRLGWALALGLESRWPNAQNSTSPEQALAQVLPGVASVLGSLVLERKVAYRPLRTASGQVLFRPVMPSRNGALPPEEPLPVLATAWGCLWVANAPGVLAYIWQRSGQGTLADHPCWTILQEGVPEPHHRFFVSLAALRRLLQQRPVAFLELLAPGETHDPVQVARAAAPAARLLSVADYAAATVQVGAGEIRFALVVLVRQQPWPQPPTR